jgi:hypothetical protein
MTELISGFAELGAPLGVTSIDDSHAVEVYEGYELFLLRPDLHIVWRGNDVPQSSKALVVIATGNR